MAAVRVGQKAAVAVVVGALVLAACGSGDDGSGDDASGAVEEPEATLTEQGEDLGSLLEDDFGDDESGWGEEETEDYVVEYTDAGYAVSVIEEGTTLWTYADRGLFVLEDSSTTLEVDEIDGVADRSYGTLCRLPRSGPVHYYALTVNGDTGSWAITRWRPDVDEVEVLAEGEDEALEGIGEDEPVEVTGTCLGEGDGEPVDLALAVDGEEVGSVTDEDGLAPGISGLVVAHPGEGGDDDPVTFTGIEIQGDEVDDGFELEDDFSDPDSGFSLVDDEFVTTTYADDGLRFDLRGSGSATLPIRAPLTSTGSIAVDVVGDLTNGYAAVCLVGDGGRYEFAITADGYASLGFYPGGDGDFVLIDEVTDAYRSTGDHRVTATWSEGDSGNELEIAVDDEVLVSATDDQVEGLSHASLCATVANAAGEGAELGFVYRDLEAVGEG